MTLEFLETELQANAAFFVFTLLFLCTQCISCLTHAHAAYRMQALVFHAKRALMPTS